MPDEPTTTPLVMTGAWRQPDVAHLTALAVLALARHVAAMHPALAASMPQEIARLDAALASFPAVAFSAR